MGSSGRQITDKGFTKSIRADVCSGSNSDGNHTAGDVDFVHTGNVHTAGETAGTVHTGCVHTAGETAGTVHTGCVHTAGGTAGTVHTGCVHTAGETAAAGIAPTRSVRDRTKQYVPGDTKRNAGGRQKAGNDKVEGDNRQ